MPLEMAIVIIGIQKFKYSTSAVISSSNEDSFASLQEPATQCLINNEVVETI